MTENTGHMPGTDPELGQSLLAGYQPSIRGKIGPAPRKYKTIAHWTVIPRVVHYGDSQTKYSNGLRARSAGSRELVSDFW